MKVVLDTNIFVSGIFWRGNSNKVILRWKEEKYQLVTSMEIISELIRVLNDFKIKMPEEMIKDWIELIVKNSVLVEPKEKIKVIKDDPEDDKFIEAAVSGNADYIVSKDKHLLKLKEYKKTKILTPEEFLKL